MEQCLASHWNIPQPASSHSDRHRLLRGAGARHWYPVPLRPEPAAEARAPVGPEQRRDAAAIHPGPEVRRCLQLRARERCVTSTSRLHHVSVTSTFASHQGLCAVSNFIVSWYSNGNDDVFSSEMVRTGHVVSQSGSNVRTEGLRTMFVHRCGVQCLGEGPRVCNEEEPVCPWTWVQCAFGHGRVRWEQGTDPEALALPFFLPNITRRWHPHPQPVAHPGGGSQPHHSLSTERELTFHACALFYVPEPDIFDPKDKLTGSQIGRDFRSLRALLERYNLTGSGHVLVGPDVARVRSDHGLLEQ